MLGHEPLIAMRRAGKRPASMVHIQTGRVHDAWHLWHERGEAPSLVVRQSEDPLQCDMRCVVGMVAHVDGDDFARVQAAYDAALRGGAVRVIATVYERRGNDFEPVRFWDSTGVWQWQR